MPLSLELLKRHDERISEMQNTINEIKINFSEIINNLKIDINNLSNDVKDTMQIQSETYNKISEIEKQTKSFSLTFEVIRQHWKLVTIIVIAATPIADLFYKIISKHF